MYCVIYSTVLLVSVIGSRSLNVGVIIIVYLNRSVSVYCNSVMER